MNVETLKTAVTSRYGKIAAYIVASGVLTELLDVVLGFLSNIDVPDKAAMLVFNLILVAVIKSRQPKVEV